jgi:hypothetical protein
MPVVLPLPELVMEKDNVDRSNGLQVILAQLRKMRVVLPSLGMAKVSADPFSGLQVGPALTALLKSVKLPPPPWKQS